MICTRWLLNNQRIPIGVGCLTWQYGEWWVTNVMASRTAPKGTGQRILRKLIREAKKHKIPYLRLGTSYANAPMLFAALHEGFKIEGTDHYGYVVRLTI